MHQDLCIQMLLCLLYSIIKSISWPYLKICNLGTQTCVKFVNKLLVLVQFAILTVTQMMTVVVYNCLSIKETVTVHGKHL